MWGPILCRLILTVAPVPSGRTTRPIKERAEADVVKLIAEVRAKDTLDLDDIILLLQRKGESRALAMIDAYYL